jgi:hypothetical protein
MTYTGKDILLGPDGDEAISNGDSALISGADAIRQQWLIRVRVFLGEWVLDETHGLPYIQEIFSKTATPSRVEEIFRKVTIDTPGVLSVESVAFEVTDPVLRSVTVNVDATIDGPEGVTFQYDGTLPLGSSTTESAASFPLTIDDLRIWLDSNDLANLTYNSPLKLVNKAGAGEANGDCTLEGVSPLGLKRSAYLDETDGERLDIADTQAIRHGDGSISMFAVIKARDASSGVERDRGVLALNGYDNVSGKKEFYNLSIRGTDTTPSSSKVVLKSGREGADALLEALDGVNGVSELDDDLDINSQIVSPTFIYRGGDALAGTWPADVGSTLSVAGAGTLPTLNTGSPCLGAGDDSVTFEDGQYYDNASTSYGDIATEDVVFEFFSEEPFGIASQICGKCPTSGAGWRFYVDAAGVARLRLEDASSSVEITVTEVVESSFRHIMFFVDRSGSATAYLNGRTKSADFVVSGLGTLTNTNVFKIGSLPTVAKSSSRIAHAAMWKQAAWLDTHLQSAVALERFSKLAGVYASTAAGTPEPTATRASVAMVDKYDGTDRKLFRVGRNWPRVCYRKDSASADFKGFLNEPDVEAICLQSEDLTKPEWTKQAATIDSTTGATAPDVRSIFHGIIADAVFTSHYVQQSIATGKGRHILSFLALKGNKDWIRIDPDTSNTISHVDLSDGSTGVTGSAADLVVEDWGFCYRVILGFDDSSAKTRDIRIMPADGDNLPNFSGDAATVNTWIWGVQFESYAAGEEAYTATSYIKTEAVLQTRQAEALYYDADDGNVDQRAPGVNFDVLSPNNLSSPSRYLLSISKAAATSDSINAYRSGNDKAVALVGSTSAEANDVFVAEEPATIALVGSRGTFSIRKDTTDANGLGEDPNENLDQINVGTKADGGFAFGGLIRNLKGF